MPYVQRCLSISLYMRSFLSIESLDLRPSNHYILVSESPSCIRLEKMCVPGKAAIEMEVQGI
jgi:hypothetical protein